MPKQTENLNTEQNVKNKEPEIKTMKRDLARLQLLETEKEREKIIRLQKEPVPTIPPQQKKGEEHKTRIKEVERHFQQKGLEREQSILDREKKIIEEKVIALKEEEKNINKQIQQIELSKKAVQNETEIQRMDDQQKKLKKEQARIQQEQSAEISKISKLAKKLSEIEQKTEEKAKEKEIRPETDELEQAKKRLQALSANKEKIKKRTEQKYSENLRARWETRKSKAVPPEMDKPIKGVESYPAKPTREQRSWVRFLVAGGLIVILAIVGLFLYWFFTKEQPGPPLPPPPKECPEFKEKTKCEEANCYWYDKACHKDSLKCEDVTNEEKCEQENCYWYDDYCHQEQQEIVPPQALIQTTDNKTIEFEAPEELKAKFQQIMQQTSEEEKTTRILFKDTKNNKFISFREFLQLFSAQAPDEFLEKLGNDPTFFIYSKNGYNRFGIIAMVQGNEDVYQDAKNWEQAMENDLDSLLTIFGKEENAGTNIFKTGRYNNVYFRYLSLPGEDFGLCWAEYKKRFIFTTSGSSIIKGIDLIKLGPPIEPTE